MATKPKKWVRLGCLTCDRDDFDGISERGLAALIEVGEWQDIDQIQSYEQAIAEVEPGPPDYESVFDWETHRGLCPDCHAADLRVTDAMDLARRIGIRPLHDLVLVDCEPPAEKIGSVHLPDATKDAEPSIRGRVLAKGPGRWCKKAKFHAAGDVCVGDRVLIERWQGKEVEWQGHDLKLVKIGDVVGVLDG